MAGENYEVHSVSPHELSQVDIATCLSLIKIGNAADYASAKTQFAHTRVVAVIKLDKQIVGVGVIKQPRPSYAASVARKCKFPFGRNMLELGYVARDPSHKGHSFSEKIVSQLLSSLPGVDLFATTSNEKMKATLKHAGFVQRGGEWAGKNKNRLSLWLREAKAK